MLERIKTRTAFLASGLLLLIGAGFAAFAVQQLRLTAERLDAVVSEHAEAVIRVERLRVAHEQIGRTARGPADGRRAPARRDARHA